MRRYVSLVESTLFAKPFFFQNDIQCYTARQSLDDVREAD